MRPVRRASRRQRVRRIAAGLTAGALVAAVAGALIYRAQRPETRRPGERLADVTEKLARDLPADAPAPRFTDVTAAAGLGDFVTFRGERSSQLPEDMGAGLAWGDFDNDGDDDLFLVSAGGGLDLPPAERAASELYENLGDGTFRKSEAFPETRILGMGAAWGDADGDGWLDLAVSGYGSLLLFRNRQGVLELDAPLPAAERSPEGGQVEHFGSGVTWGDFDNDRDLDLYVCGYVRYAPPSGGERRATEQYGAAVPFTLNPASFEPERNLLWRNDGVRADGTVAFTEVAALYGVSNPEGRSLGALWHDFDADGRLDLYVANDISDNALYLNRQDTFEDVGLLSFVADYRGAMGLAAGDWNRDGDDDLFITHWIAQENALYDARLSELPGAGAAKRLTFSDMAAPLGLGQIALQRIGWGTEFADFDADGWLDLVVANGSTFEDDSLPPRLKPQPPFLFWNRQGESYHDLAPLADAFAPHVGRGLAVSDYDADGDLDLAIYHLGEGVQLLRNDMKQGAWLQVRLLSRGPDGDAESRLRPLGATGNGEGATVVARAGGVTLRRSVTGASYLSQSSLSLHFGLGDARQVDELEVRWLAGEPQVFTNLEANAAWQLTEDDPQPRRLQRPATASAPLDDKQRLVEFWSTQRAAMDALKRDGDVPRAILLLRQALALNPAHGDSRYYLANCLAIEGRTGEALAELDRLRRAEPMSHRAHKQWGVLRAVTAASPGDLEAARLALERALEINQEETGSLLVLGEIALLEGDRELADQRFEWACRTNPKAVGGFFLRGYLAWKRGEAQAASALLAQAHAARGEAWKPEGTVAEGDVATRMHREQTPLTGFWEAWDGTPDPAVAFAGIDARLGS